MLQRRGCYFFIVIAGLDPAIQKMSTFSGCPGQAHGCPVKGSRGVKEGWSSIFIVILGLDPRIQGPPRVASTSLDARVKPGHDS